MEYFKFPDHQRESIGIIRAYTENTMAFLRRQHPNVPTSTIQSFVSSEIARSLKRPVLKMINYPSYGNANIETTDLLNYTETLRANIITPAGVTYMPPSVKESFLKRKILDNGVARKVQKKKMLAAAVAGDLGLEQRANYLQSQIKIENNSIPGAFGSAHNCLYDKPGYNAVTSVGRHSIMCAYSHVEKMLEGNFYFPTLDHCINYCMQLVRHCPKDLASVVVDYTIKTPSVIEVADHFINSLRFYQRITEKLRSALISFLTSLSTNERTFVFYAYCLKTLIMHNDHIFRPFLTEFFRTDVIIDSTIPLGDIFKFNSDLLAMVSGLNADVIDRKSVSEAVIEKLPGISHLIAIGSHMQSKLDSIGRLIAAFLRVDCDVADAMSHPHMIRKAVIISDTDSVIFSTQSWVEWYLGKIAFTPEASAINGFVVFLIVMTLEQVFARLSANIGSVGEDVRRISMKNEFHYPLMLRTPLPKQYAGLATIQEGFVLPKTKEDIKGLSFRSSTMCQETVKAGKAFVNWIFDNVTTNGHLQVADCLEKVLDHEKRVIRSLEAGERSFLTTSPVKNEDDYKDPAISNYYYWKLWDTVFKPTFGEFIIPNKGYVIPLLSDGKVLRDERYLARVRTFDSSLYERLVEFLDGNKRAITRLVIPMTLKQIPVILRPIIDIRGIVFSNSTPFSVTMRSLGIAYTSAKDQTLLSDIYTKDEFGCSLSDSVDGAFNS
jgi:hypothetical protein